MFRYTAPDPQMEVSTASSAEIQVSIAFGKRILPSLEREPETITPERLKKIQQKYDVEIRRGTIDTHDQASLDTIEFVPKSESKTLISNQYFIIKFNANSRFYMDFLEQFAFDASKVKETVIGFDYRGVNQSTRLPEQFIDLVVDGIAQVQRLLSMGADPEKITLDGISLGAAVATFVASFFHHKKQRVYLWNDRGFASLELLVKEVLRYQLPEFLGALCDYPLTLIAESIVRKKRWGIEVAAPYLSIPDPYKGHLFIEKKSFEVGVFSNNEFFASAILDSSVLDHELFSRYRMPQDGRYVTTCYRSEGDDNIPHRVSLHKVIKEEESKRHVKTGYKVIAHCSFFPDETCGHRALRKQLISKEDLSKTGQDMFEEFVLSHKK